MAWLRLMEETLLQLYHGNIQQDQNWTGDGNLLQQINENFLPKCYFLRHILSQEALLSLLSLYFCCCFLQLRGGLWPRPRIFLNLRAKKELSMLFWPIFGNCCCPVVTLVTFRINLSNFERNPEKPPQKTKKNPFFFF